MVFRCPLRFTTAEYEIARMDAREQFHEVINRWLPSVAYLLGVDSIFGRKFKITAYTIFTLVISMSFMVVTLWLTYNTSNHQDAVITGVHCFVSLKARIWTNLESSTHNTHNE